MHSRPVTVHLTAVTSRSVTRTFWWDTAGHSGTWRDVRRDRCTAFSGRRAALCRLRGWWVERTTTSSTNRRACAYKRRRRAGRPRGRCRAPRVSVQQRRRNSVARRRCLVAVDTCCSCRGPGTCTRASARVRRRSLSAVADVGRSQLLRTG